jgi:hypothetical protein
MCRAVTPPPDRPTARLTLAVALAAAAFWAFDLAVLRCGVPDPLDDLWEYGIAARALLAGEGLRTTVLHPPLWALRDAVPSVPVLIHGPLPSMLLAIPLALAGEGALDHAAWLAALFAVVAAVIVFRLGTERFGPAVGAAAAGLFTLSPLVIRAVHHDAALVIGAALLVAAFRLLAGARARPFAAGVALGLCHLARPEMLYAAPLFALAARRGAPALLAGFVLTSLPWWAHNAAATGQPFFSLSSYMMLGYWGARPELSPLRDFTLTPAEFPHVLMEALPGLWPKWLELHPHALKRALMAPSGGTGWLALLGLTLGLARPELRRWTLLAATLASLPVAIQTLTLYDARYLVPFLPLWTLAAAWASAALAARAPAWARRPRLWMGALLLLTLPSTVPALKAAHDEARLLERRLAEERAALAPVAIAPGERAGLLFSDTPDFVSWTTRRSVVWLTREEWLALPGAGDPNVDALPERGDAEATWFGGYAPGATTHERRGRR